MCDHGSIGLLLGNGGFLVGNLALSVFWPFPFLFLFSVRRTSHQRTGFWLAIKGRGPLWFVVSFLFSFCLFDDNSCIVQISSGLKTFLPISSVFFQSLIGNFRSFLFRFFLIFDWEFSFFLCFLPRARIMVSWDFGSRLVEWLDMIYVRVWFGSRIKRNVPHYFHDTHATMMIWKFYAKLVMHASTWTLKCQIFMVM